MKIIAWNCHRLGNGAAVHGLLNIQKEDPFILFLSETKMDKRRMEKFRWTLGLTNMIAKDCDGRSGGLAIFWRKGINMHVRGISHFYIDVDITEMDGSVWRLTGFYGNLLWRRRTCRGRRCTFLMLRDVSHGCAWGILTKFC